MAAGKSLGALIAQFGADVSDWDRAFDKMENDMRQMERKATSTAQKMGQAFDRASDRLGSVGKTLTTRVTLPLAGAAAGSLKMAADFDTSMRQITGLVGIAADKVEAMKGRVLGLAGETARSPQELAEALFFVTSAGFEGQEALDVLESSAKAAAAGLGETKTITDAVTSAVNAYGIENLSASEATDTLVAAVREGKLEASALAPVLGNILPTASAMGISFQQAAGMLALFSRTGTDAAEGATSLQAIMLSLMRPTDEVRKLFSSVGTSADELRQIAGSGPDGLLNVFQKLEEEFKGNEEALAQLFPNIRAFRGVMNAVSQDSETARGILMGVNESLGATEFGFESAQGPAFKFNQALQKLKTAGINLGEALFPIFTELIDFVTPLIDHLASLNKETLKMYAIAGAAAAGLGPLLIIVSKIMKGVRLLAVVIFSKFALITGVFASTVVAGQYMVDNWEKIKQGLINISTAIYGAFLQMAETTVWAVKWMIEEIVNMLSMGGLPKMLGLDIGEMTTGLLGMDDALDMLGGMIDEQATKLEEGIGRYNDLEWGSIGDSASNALELAKNTIMRGLEGLLNNEQIQALIDKVNEMFSGEGAGSGVGDEIGGSSMRTGTPDVMPEGFSTDYLGNVERIIEANNGWKQSMDSVQDKGIEMGQALQSALQSAVVGFSESIGQMIAQGAKGESFFNMMLELIGDFAVQFGQASIAMGLAAKGLRPENLFGSGGTSAIVAGAALVAIGTALKGIVSAGPGGYGGGGSSASAGPVARSVPSTAENRFEVEFKIGNDALVGTMQKKNRRDKRVGRSVNLGG